jgi:hypothetical protein
MTNETMDAFVSLTVGREHRFLGTDKLAAQDHDLAREIHDTFSMMTSYGDQFGAAVHLFDFSSYQCAALMTQMDGAVSVDMPRDKLFREAARRQALRQEFEPRRRVFSEWMFIAARQGAICLFNLGKSMEGVRADLKKCPSLNALVDQEKVSEATRILRERFPRFEGIRHFVAHDAEFSRSRESRTKHALRDAVRVGDFMEAGAANPIGQNLNGDEFLCSFEGKLVSYQINVESFQHAKAAILTMIGAFDAAMH